MKLRALSAVLCLPVLLFAQTQAPAPAAPAPAAPNASASGDSTKGTGATGPTITVTAPGKSAPAAAKKDDAKSAAAKKTPTPTAKKEDPPAVVEGVAIVRPNGGFLGLRVVNNNFVLSFYDAKKKKIDPDVTRAAVRWPVKYQPGDEHAVLNLSGKTLTSAKVVKPPLVFKVYLGLYNEGSDKAVESYTIDYHGE